MKYKTTKNIESKIPKVAKIKSGRIMLLSKCVVCDSKTSKISKNQKASELRSSLGIKLPLSRISSLDLLLF